MRKFFCVCFCAMAVTAIAFIPLSCNNQSSPYVTYLGDEGIYYFFDYDGDGKPDYYFLYDNDGYFVTEGYYPEEYPYNFNIHPTGTNDNSIHQTGTNNNETGTNNNPTGTNNNQTGTNNNNTGTNNNITIPGTPSNVRATAQSTNSIRIEWNPVSGATGYKLYMANTSGGSYNLTASPTATSHVVSGLSASTTRYFRVSAVNSAGESGQSSPASATTQANNSNTGTNSVTIPGTPGNVRATAQSTSSILVEWNSVSGATGYKLYMANTSGGSYNLTASPTATSYVVNGLSASTTRYFKVSAVNSAGESNQSSPASATTQANSSNPEPPPITNPNGSIIKYADPPGEVRYQGGISMSSGGQDIPLYKVQVNNNHTWNPDAGGSRQEIPVGMFDITGSPALTISGIGTDNLMIRPVGKNVSRTVSGNSVTMVIPSTGQYSVEWGNNAANAVLIFASPQENFSGGLGPGMHYGTQTVDNQTLVIQGGAVLRGKVILRNNAKVIGRGIIDGSQMWNWNNGRNNAQIPIETYKVNNAEIRGISVFDPDGWAVQLLGSSGITIDNFKIISSRCNSDGISIQSTNGVTITNSFLRTWDDGVVLKNYGFDGVNSTRDVTVRNTIFWTDLAQAMEIGFETNKGSWVPAPSITNVLFEDIIVFHALHKAPISIHNGDDANISGVTFRNITIENFQSGLGDGWELIIDITNVPAGQISGASGGWTTHNGWGGEINGIVQNVNVLGGKGSRNVRKQGDRINVNTPW